jgi:hypothetical protein
MDCSSTKPEPCFDPVTVIESNPTQWTAAFGMFSNPLYHCFASP